MENPLERGAWWATVHRVTKNQTRLKQLSTHARKVSTLFWIIVIIMGNLDFPGGSDGKASVYNAGDLGSTPGSGRFPGEGNGNPLQYSCLENPMDGGAWCPWGRKESDTTEQLGLKDMKYKVQFFKTLLHISLALPPDHLSRGQYLSFCPSPTPLFRDEPVHVARARRSAGRRGRFHLLCPLPLPEG